MKIKLIYIIIFFLIFLIGTRGYNYFYSEYLPYDEKTSEAIYQHIEKDSGIICVLIPHKTHYRIGERPELDVLIINKTDSTIYLPGNMDGSSYGFRLPVTDFKVLNRKPRKYGLFCPMFNPMVPDELRRVKPGECFNPFNTYRIETIHYAADSILGWDAQTLTRMKNYWPHEALDAHNFLLPGNYDIQFVYSTKKDSTVLMGLNISNEWPKEKMNILDSIPVVELKSNVVRLKYRIF
ncbi:hypothetical protein [Bacteroides sp. 519]|uniref:hypothetical protein n=1 Tax=Bacteroides sp. 519 TaxID=2302937 RepID=UPI0013D25E35|nr:hypothetical protein [Bacteroides sp. 519]NDV59363.1 hypothetical protein [Bacteroides sp. 519]